MTSLRDAALGFAIAELDHGVREVGGQNTGPRVRKYLENAEINVAAPWCAAFVQYVTDAVCNLLVRPNPLDAVKLEAYVQSYHEWAKNAGVIIPAEQAGPGDLVLYNFNGQRWDHIGILLDAPTDKLFRAIEGNTNDGGAREGDAVQVRVRSMAKNYPVEFVRWAA